MEQEALASTIDHSALPELRRLCRRYRVLRLDLFGSAATGGYDPARSDVDLLVQFEAMPPVEHAENYFAFLEELESLFAKTVDLVNADSIRNPYFRESVERTRRRLYAA